VTTAITNVPSARLDRTSAEVAGDIDKGRIHPIGSSPQSLPNTGQTLRIVHLLSSAGSAVHDAQSQSGQRSIEPQ
jgi:hypothetical protein